MRVVLQRVAEAAVAVGEKEKASIKKGFLLLVGVAKEDSADTVVRMAQKISKLRVFEDARGKMNLDLSQVNGEVLSVPQFTLLGTTEKGNRPAFTAAAAPDSAKYLWAAFNDALKDAGIKVRKGEFAAHMRVSLINDGPVTFVLDSKQEG